jgi:hypothetical protein
MHPGLYVFRQLTEPLRRILMSKCLGALIIIPSLLLLSACTNGKVRLTPGPGAVPVSAKDLLPIGHYDGYADFVAIKGDFAYIGSVSRFLVWDVSNLFQPVFTGSSHILRANVRDMVIQKNNAFIADGSGFTILNISSRPLEVGSCDTPGTAVGVAIAGNSAYLANEEAGLRILDISDLTHPAEVSFFNTPDSAKDVKLAGSYAYIAGGTSGLRVVDISNSANPAEVGFYDTPGKAESLVVLGNYAYIADNESGLRVLDVSNPAHPIEVGFYDTPGKALDVVVEGNYAYIADWDGLLIVDISNPMEVADVGFYPMTATKVAVVGNTVYVTGGYTGLSILQFVP